MAGVQMAISAVGRASPGALACRRSRFNTQSVGNDAHWSATDDGRLFRPRGEAKMPRVSSYWALALYHGDGHASNLAFGTDLYGLLVAIGPKRQTGGKPR